MAQYAALDDVFMALSDPTRRAVIGRLGEGPASVGELAEPFAITLPSFMKHVRTLEASGLIRTRKSGRVRTCTLNHDRLGIVENWLTEQRALWERRTDRLERFVIDEVTDEQEQQTSIDPDLDLELQRVIRAPRAAIWRAWTDPDRLRQWWVPAPTIARVDRLEVRPGGAFVTSMSDDGHAFIPHSDSVFLVIEPEARLVFTNAIDSRWRPATPAPVAMTAEITLADHPDGCDYRAVVRHGDPADRDRHEELGFFDGWGSVTAALAELVESEVRA